jgi:hypothetical protein
MTLTVLALLAAGSLEAHQAVDFTPYLITDRAAEVALARTAAPHNVSDSATVLVLTRTGYVEAARGTNGFTCVVLRSFSASPGDPNYWNPRVRAPHCFNPPAVRTVLPITLKRAEWVLAGVPAAEIEGRTDRGYASKEIPRPAAGAMAYMTSAQQYLVDENPHWMPHLMFYYDRSLPASAWGAAGMTATVIDATAGDPHSPVLTLLIPVRQWSDGSPAMTGSTR